MKAKPFIPSMWADDAVGLYIFHDDDIRPISLSYFLIYLIEFRLETVANEWMGGAIDKLLKIIDKSELAPCAHPPEALKQLVESTTSLSIANKSTNAKLEECSDSDKLDNSSLKSIPFNEVLINNASNVLKYFRLDFEILKIPSRPIRILEIMPGCQITEEVRSIINNLLIFNDCVNSSFADLLL